MYAQYFFNKNIKVFITFKQLNGMSLMKFNFKISFLNKFQKFYFIAIFYLEF